MVVIVENTQKNIPDDDNDRGCIKYHSSPNCKIMH